MSQGLRLTQFTARPKCRLCGAKVRSPKVRTWAECGRCLHRVEHSNCCTVRKAGLLKRKRKPRATDGTSPLARGLLIRLGGVGVRSAFRALLERTSDQ
jgi:hypothetical protein